MVDFKNNTSLNWGSKGKIFYNARSLRASMTRAEEIMWNELRNSRLDGYKFRRQHPIGRFIADFYCHEARLVVEVDGEIHNESENMENDADRTDELDNLNIKVIRFTNNEVLNSINMVLTKIYLAIQQSLVPPDTL